ncbi:MAG: hypothetical protein ACYTG4_11315, partial [Planctomycetota bacterium]
SDILPSTLSTKVSSNGELEVTVVDDGETQRAPGAFSPRGFGFFVSPPSGDEPLFALWVFTLSPGEVAQ